MNSKMNTNGRERGAARVWIVVWASEERGGGGGGGEDCCEFQPLRRS